jgi:hypothetical protein
MTLTIQHLKAKTRMNDGSSIDSRYGGLGGWNYEIRVFERVRLVTEIAQKYFGFGIRIILTREIDQKGASDRRPAAAAFKIRVPSYLPPRTKVRFGTLTSSKWRPDISSSSCLLCW